MPGAPKSSAGCERKMSLPSPIEGPAHPGPKEQPCARPLPGWNEALRRFWLPLFFSFHMLFTAVCIGLRTEHVLIYLLVLALWAANDRTRLFLKTALPFWVFGACFDALRLIPKAWTRQIHVAELYQAEKFLFGLDLNGVRVTPSEYLSSHATPIVDLPAGIFYLTYLPVFFAFFVYLFWRNLALARRLALCFLLLNLAGVLTFQIFPAAPPWYVTYYGLGPADPATPPHPAGMLRFDALVGLPIAQTLYSKSPDVFGALPSLHVANPVLLFLYARRLGRFWGLSALAYALGVAFSALYLNHHYVLDVLAGALYAGISYCLIPAGAARASRARRPSHRSAPAVGVITLWRENRRNQRIRL